MTDHSDDEEANKFKIYNIPTNDNSDRAIKKLMCVSMVLYIQLYFNS